MLVFCTWGALILKLGLADTQRTKEAAEGRLLHE